MAVQPPDYLAHDIDSFLVDLRDVGLIPWLRNRLDQMAPADVPPIPPGLRSALAAPRVITGKPTMDSAPAAAPWVSSIAAAGKRKSPGRPALR